MDAKEAETIRQYLLGQASVTDLSQIEERLLTDGALYEELLIIEDELVDQYVGRRLSDSERECFENHFMLTSERQGKVRFARVLNKYVNAARTDSRPQEDLSAEDSSEERSTITEPHKKPFFWVPPFRHPIFSYSVVAAAALVVVGISWVVLKNLSTSSPRGPGNVFAVALEPGLTRDSGEIRKFSIPPNTDTIRLELALPDNQYQYYEAILQDGNGHILLTKKNLKAQSFNGHLTLLVDVTPMSPGDYRLILNGLIANGNIESVASYSFRVLSR